MLAQHAGKVLHAFSQTALRKVAPSGQLEIKATEYVACPFMGEGLSTLYQDLLSGSYDCVDRIVLNAYFRMGHDPGGFRLWWRQLTGSDATLDNAHLMRLAGRFARRIRGYAKAHNIPVVNCAAGERKHEIAEELSRQDHHHGGIVPGLDQGGRRRRCGFNGFTASELRHASELGKRDPGTLWSHPRGVRPEEFRGQQIVQRIGQTRRYAVCPAGLKTITALIVLREKAIRPLLAAAQKVKLPAAATRSYIFLLADRRL